MDLSSCKSMIMDYINYVCRHFLQRLAEEHNVQATDIANVGATASLAHPTIIRSFNIKGQVHYYQIYVGQIYAIDQPDKTLINLLSYISKFNKFTTDPASCDVPYKCVEISEARAHSIINTIRASFEQ